MPVVAFSLSRPGLLDLEPRGAWLLASALSLPIYAFAAALGAQRVIDAARLVASQAGIPDRDLTLVNDSATYAHVDPLAASPQNDFLNNLLPFLKKLKAVKKHPHPDHGRG